MVVQDLDCHLRFQRFPFHLVLAGCFSRWVVVAPGVAQRMQERLVAVAGMHLLGACLPVVAAGVALPP